jgi:H/ACA ribonucleoprotein complex non-core subunit NAF1
MFTPSYRRGESMGPSQSSRSQIPSQMLDQDLSYSSRTAPIVDSDSFYGSNPYDEHGPYDANYGNTAASMSNSRTLMAYDDPYAEPVSPIDQADKAQVSAAIDELIASTSKVPSGSNARRGAPLNLQRPQRGRGRGTFGGADGDRGHGGGAGAGAERSRGRGRGRGNDLRARGRGRGGGQDGSRSPTSMAIARATGQYTDGNSFPQPQSMMHMQIPSQDWGYGFPETQQQQYGFDYGFAYNQAQGQRGGHGQQSQQSYVQPHINPRFAAQWGWMAQNGAWQPPSNGDIHGGGH